jgi:hypothetical protein
MTDSDKSKDFLFSPECNDSGNWISSLEYSPEFSVADVMDSVPFATLPTDNEVSEYSFLYQLAHYID